MLQALALPDYYCAFQKIMVLKTIFCKNNFKFNDYNLYEVHTSIIRKPAYREGHAMILKTSF